VRSEVNRGIVHASNAALALATGDFIAFLDHDDELTPDALAEVARRIAADPDLDVVYSDEDKIDEGGVRREPHFKPDFSPAQLRSCMYISHLTVMRRQRLMEVGGLRPAFEGAQDYDAMLRVAERSSRIAHVPKVLYHWRATPDSAASSQLSKPWAIAAVRRALDDHVRRANLQAVVEPTRAAGHFRIRYDVRGAPRVSILVALTGPPGGDQRPSHLTAIAAATKYPAIDFVIASEAPLPENTQHALGGIAHRLVVTGAASLPVQLNAAARAAGGDHLLMLDPRAEPLARDWLDALLEFSQQRTVGSVGAFLLNPDRTIDHAGLVLGVGTGVASALHGDPEWMRGHLGTAEDVRNCSAVSGACLMTRREVFERVGGFDEHLAALFDVDYGLRVRRAGLQVVITPHARIRSSATSARLGAAPRADIERLRSVWGAAVERDPYYNPHFDRRAATFRLPAAAPSSVDVPV
jgi:GT2 family glycosyltransferase